MINSILRWLSDAGHGILKRIINVLICVDQLAFSVITLGSACPDETISAAAYRFDVAGRWQGKLFRPLIDALFWFDPYHCKRAHEAEIYGYQRPNK